MPIAETIAIGTELLLGEIQDTNTHYLARQLRNAGIDFYRATIIGDNSVRIAQAIKDAASRSDIVITSGGLGPTIDDATREAVAFAAGVNLEFHEPLWVDIMERFRRYGRKPTENNRRQAFLPQGATAINNPVGTAPAFAIEIDGSIVICLPGVPRELETLLNLSVFPMLKQRFQLRSVLKSVVIHASGVGESQIDEWISDLEFGANPTVGLLAHPGVTDIRITARADSDFEADQMVNILHQEILKRIGDAYFGEDATTLEQKLDQMLSEKNWNAFIVLDGFGENLKSRISELKSTHINIVTSLLNPQKTSNQKVPDPSRYEIIIKAKLIPELNQTNLTFTISTPDRQDSINRSHGGHPELAQTWAENLILDHIRRYLLIKTK